MVGAWLPDTGSRSASDASRLPAGQGRARCVRGILRESGLLFGTPNMPTLGAEAKGPEEQLFLAVLRVFTRIALDVAAQADAAPGPRPEQVLLLFAALMMADELHELRSRPEPQAVLPIEVPAIPAQFAERLARIASRVENLADLLETEAANA